MNRRAFLLALAAGTIAATAGTAGASASTASTAGVAGTVGTSGAAAPGRRRGSAEAAGRDGHRPGLHQPGVHQPGVSQPQAATELTSSAAAGAPPPAPPALGPHAEPMPAVADLPDLGVVAIETVAPAVPAVPPQPINLATVPRLITGLPGADPTVAITVDDGTDTAVVGAYLDFAEASGVRLTFFLNGVNRSWTDHKDQLRRLIESGQVQVGNHTWSHPDITGLSDSALANEIKRNEKFINDAYGVTGRPFLRPPYGYHSNRTDRVCADLGYSSITMWYGSFGDSSVLSEAELMGLARQWLTAHRVVIGHANHPTVTHLYPQLLDLIKTRGLTTVTLDDAFYGGAGRDRTNLA